jgi:hypothetical protein
MALEKKIVVKKLQKTVNENSIENMNLTSGNSIRKQIFCVNAPLNSV